MGGMWLADHSECRRVGQASLCIRLLIVLLIIHTAELG